ncbi:MAG: PD-(D/E)XK nuclease family protein, partial [Clostridiales bacterium]|nr:PD-(D/E)XK nuclease family protein [Clostridiales bacterium]
RILYVAMTRARERLVIVGGAAGFGRSLSRWRLGCHALPSAVVEQDRCYLDWLGRALLPHADAQELRLLAGFTPETLLGEPGMFNISIAGGEAEGAPEAPFAPEKETRGGEVERILNWQYPYQTATTLAAKWTVSGLQNQGYQAEKAPFWAGGESSSVEEGNAYHKVMELLDFSRTEPRQIEEQLAALTREGRLTPEEAAPADGQRLAAFFSSSLGIRLRRAEKTVRELPFVYALSAAELGPGAPPDDQVLLQGRIDLAFCEGGGWVIVDYKTGAYGADEEELRRRYGTQLAWYKRALADIWRQEVRECYLYLFSSGCAVRMD